MLYRHHGSDSHPLQIYGSLKHERMTGGHKNTHKLVEDIVVFTWHNCYAVTLCSVGCLQQEYTVWLVLSTCRSGRATHCVGSTSATLCVCVDRHVF
jgi:hypothetical protein